jgi:hypothetical protein
MKTLIAQSQINIIKYSLTAPETIEASPEIDRAPCKIQLVLFQSTSIDQVPE